LCKRYLHKIWSQNLWQVNVNFYRKVKNWGPRSFRIFKISPKTVKKAIQSINLSIIQFKVSRCPPRINALMTTHKLRDTEIPIPVTTKLTSVNYNKICINLTKLISDNASFSFKKFCLFNFYAPLQFLPNNFPFFLKM